MMATLVSYRGQIQRREIPVSPMPKRLWWLGYPFDIEEMTFFLSGEAVYAGYLPSWEYLNA